MEPRRRSLRAVAGRPPLGANAAPGGGNAASRGAAARRRWKTRSRRTLSEDNAQNATGRDDRSEDRRLLLRAGLAGGPWLGVLAITALAIAGAELTFPAVLGGALNAVIEDDNARWWLLWCVLLVAGLVVFDMLDDLAAGIVVARSTAWLRHRLLGQVLALGT